MRCLRAAGVEHDANAGPERCGGEVSAELGADNALVSVGAHDSAPDAAELSAVFAGRLGLARAEASRSDTLHVHSRSVREITCEKYH